MFSPPWLVKPFLLLSLFASYCSLLGCGTGAVQTAQSTSQETSELGTISDDGKSLTIRWETLNEDLLDYLRKQDSITELRIVSLRRNGLELLKHIAQLEQLESLSLIEVTVSDDELESLACLKNLKSLELSKTGISGTGLRYIEELPLKHLIFREFAASAGGVQSIGKLSQLEELELMLPEFHLTALPSFAGLPKLRSLKILDGCYSYREFGGLNCLIDAQSIRELTIAGRNINDRSMQAISRLANLEQLEVGDSHVSNRGIQYLVGLAQLHSLNVRSVESKPIQTVVGNAPQIFDGQRTRG